MKKLLLTGGLILGLGVSCIAQNAVELNCNSKQTLQTIEKTKKLKKSIKVAQTRNESKKTALVPLMNYYNLYPVGRAHKPFSLIDFDKTTKTVIFTGKSVNTDEGEIYGRVIYNYSTDNGNNWNEEFIKAYEPYYISDKDPDAYVRFPLGFVMNPSNSSDHKDLYFSYYTNTDYNISNGNLKDLIYPYNLLPLGENAPEKSFKIDVNDGEKAVVDPFESCKTKKHIFLVENSEKLEKQNDGTNPKIVPQKSILLIKGTIENEEITYKRILIDAESIAKKEIEGAEVFELYEPRIIFNEDASLGYIAFHARFVADENNPITIGGYLFILKSTDAGETWSKFDSFKVSGNSKGMEALAQNPKWPEEWWISKSTKEKVPILTEEQKAHVITFPDCGSVDIAIDKDNNPIVIADIAPFHYKLGVYTLFTDPFLFHKKDGVWTAEKLHVNSTSLQYDHSDNNYKHIMCNRFTFVNTPDHSCNYILYIDSDYKQDGDIVRALIKPDIYYAAYKDGELIQAGVPSEDNNKRDNFNLTRKSDANNICFWPTFAKEMSIDPDDDKMYRAHSVIIEHEDNAICDQRKIIQYNYIKNLRLPIEPGSNHKFVDENSGVDEINPVFASVSQNVPNPFNGITKVDVELTEAADLSLVVTNVSGQRIMSIEKGQSYAGKHSFEIDGSNLDAGVYFYSVFAGESSVTKKMIIE